MARQELQVELKKLESDYEQKLQDLSQEKEQLASSKQEKEKEIQGLQQQLSTLKEQVHSHSQELAQFSRLFYAIVSVTLEKRSRATESHLVTYSETW